jgi:hypothetical protein
MDDFDFTALAASQTDHPVILPVTVEALREMGPEVAVEFLDERDEIIATMATERIVNGFRPARWRRIDLALARKRLQHPAPVIELIVLGGQDSGKTDGCVHAVCSHLWHTHKHGKHGAHVWFGHTDRGSSQKVHQPRVYEFLPASVLAKLGESGRAKRNQNQSIGYSAGSGFTGDAFTMQHNAIDGLSGVRKSCGGTAVFKWYTSADTNRQGSKITSATSDENVTEGFASTVKERLMNEFTKHTTTEAFLDRIRECIAILETGDQLPPHLLGLLYTKVHVLGFTPIEGYKALVAGVLDGAEVIEEEEAELLPIFGEGHVVIGHEKVPVIKQPRNPYQIVAYLPTHSNPFADVAAKKADMEGKPYDYIRVRYYGDVQKSWDSTFSAFKRSTHVIPWAEVPRNLTIYESLDPAGAKPFFASWYGVSLSGAKYVLQEWPCPSVAINGRLPGLWAVQSKLGNMNGDLGPAAKLRLNWSNEEYLAMLYQGRMRLFDMFAKTGEPFAGKFETRTLSWPEGAKIQPITGTFVVPENSIIDCRWAQSELTIKQGEQTLDIQLCDFENGIVFSKSSGVRIEVGDNLISSSLSATIFGKPELQVVEDCENHIFSLETWAGKITGDEAAKEPRDTCAYFLLSSPIYIDNEHKNFGGFSF